MVATPFHGSRGSVLGLDTRAPSISPVSSNAPRIAVTAPPSCTSSERLAARTAYCSITAPRPSAGGPPLIFQYGSEASVRTAGLGSAPARAAEGTLAIAPPASAACPFAALGAFADGDGGQSAS